MNSIEINRRILEVNGKLNLYPWMFEAGGKVTKPHSSLRSLGYKIQLIFAALYTAYIDLRLLRTVLGGFHNVRYDVFGIHLMRGMLATMLSYWAYLIFAEHADEHEILHNFSQQSPGK